MIEVFWPKFQTAQLDTTTDTVLFIVYGFTSNVVKS